MKQPTSWSTQSGYDTSTGVNAGYKLLLETGGYLLLETGFDLLLEDNLVVVKEATAWTTPAKQATPWAMGDGMSTPTLVTYTRITEQGDTRITEQGDTRVSEDTQFAEKSRTVWSEA